MERETTKIKTPVDNIEVELKTYMTGRERREIQKIFIESADFNIDSDAKVNTQMSGKSDLINRSQDKTIELMVVGVNGEKEDLLNKILDMKSQDYDFVLAEIDKISNSVDKKNNRLL